MNALLTNRATELYSVGIGDLPPWVSIRFRNISKKKSKYQYFGIDTWVSILGYRYDKSIAMALPTQILK